MPAGEATSHQAGGPNNRYFPVMLAEIDIETETEHDTYWAYVVSVFAGGRVHKFDVRLSFQDYDLWSRGRVAPSRVADACVRYLLERADAADLAEQFDCATLRRSYPELDAELPAML